MSADDTAPKDAFNPLLALQTVLSGELLSSKQRSKAAQQLATELLQLPATPSVYLSYEPYLPLLVENMVAKSTKDVQESVLKLLITLSSHNPRRFGDWITQHIHVHVGQEVWFVEWSYGLLLETEKRVPRVDADESLLPAWKEKTMEFLEFDAALGRIVQLWRTLLDQTMDGLVVAQIVKKLHALLLIDDADRGVRQWTPILRKKLQPHFVDIADILIGWAMSVSSVTSLREDIVAVLVLMRQLWMDNSVFSLQLLTSFSNDIVELCTSTEKTLAIEERVRLSTLLVCFMMVAQSVPHLALSSSTQTSSPLSRVLLCAVTSRHLDCSLFCITKCAQYLVSISVSMCDEFAPLAVMSIRLLFNQAAMLVVKHEGNIDELLTIIESAVNLAIAGSSTSECLGSIRTHAVELLLAEVSVCNDKHLPASTSLKVMESLLQVKYSSGMKHLSHVCLLLMRLGGLPVMEAVATNALRCVGLNDVYGENSCFLYWSTCFILATKDRAMTHVRHHDDGAIVRKLFMVFAVAIHEHQPPRGENRQFRMLLKLSHALLCFLSRRECRLLEYKKLIQDLSSRMVEGATQLLQNNLRAIRDPSQLVELLNLLSSLFSRREWLPVISDSVGHDVITKLEITSRDEDVTVREQSVQVLKALANRHVEFSSTIFNVSLDRLLDSDDWVRKLAFNDLCNLTAGTALLLRQPSENPVHHAQIDCSSFTMVDFELVLGLLSNLENEICEWNEVCEDIYGRTQQAVGSVIAQRPSASELFFGTVRQAAAWCIQNRLRTHFGGPSQTFSSIERLLTMYTVADANEVRTFQATHRPASEDMEEFLEKFGATDISKCSLSKMNGGISKWMTLEFINALELYMTQAITSTHVESGNPESESFKTSSFFKTNKKVCDEWLGRIRPLLVDLTSTTPSWELLRHHAYAMVSTSHAKLKKVMGSFGSQVMTEELYGELKVAENNFDTALYNLCRSHCELKDVDSIIGILKWGEVISQDLSSRYKVSGSDIYVEQENWEVPLFRWINAVRYEAGMRYAEAAAVYEEILAPIVYASNHGDAVLHVNVANYFESPITYLRMSSSALLGCFKQCARCYSSLRDWNRLQQFVTQVLDVIWHLAGHGRSIECFQSIMECSEVWQYELALIRNLESQKMHETILANEGDPKENRIPSADQLNSIALTLQSWGILDESDRRMARSFSSLSQKCQMEKLESKLKQICLHPFPWYGCAGENVGKDIEQILLSVDGLLVAKRDQSIPRAMTGVVAANRNLDALAHDSTLWCRTYYRFKESNVSSSDSLSPEVRDSVCQYLLQVAKLARKQRNVNLASRLLMEAEQFVASSDAEKFVVYERARLLDSSGMSSVGLQTLKDLCDKSLNQMQNDSAGIALNAVARPFLRLASIAQQAETPEESSYMSSIIHNFQLHNGNMLDNVSTFTSIDSTAGGTDMVGKCLSVATAVSPTNPKVWLRYSDWCYEQGRQEVEGILKHDGTIELSSSEASSVEMLLDEMKVSEVDRKTLMGEFLQLMDSNTIIAERDAKLRRLCLRLKVNAPDIIDQLIALQKGIHSRVLRCHRLAAHGYGAYLSTVANFASTVPSHGQKIMAALRLLRLLTDFGMEDDMADALRDSFIHGPLDAWSHVIPQLLSRISHPIPTVSELVGCVLTRLARHSPHVIVYPTIVESMERQSQSIAVSNDQGLKHVNDILAELRAVSDGLVDGTRLLLSELRRISVLWDEAWIAVLMKLSADVARRTNTLEKEAARVKKNATLSAKEKSELARRKFAAIMKPVLLSIEKVWRETCGNAGELHVLTPHERLFLHEYGGAINEALTKFHDCCNLDDPVSSTPDTPKPQVIWEPFAEILKSLLNSTGRNDQLPVQEISPAMASFSNEQYRTSMPGMRASVTNGTLEPVVIQKIQSSVQVLRTKTKPKCLEFMGSDGRTYKYLLKAREDLRLDERIMQLLRTVNHFLKMDKVAASRNLAAQNYSVTPLSKDAGLIQMVPDVIPLFQVFTTHNERLQNSKSTHMSPPNKNTSANGAGQTAQQPPTAAFYSKLKQYGITDVSPNHRSQWPLAVLRRVYQDLAAHQSRNMLQNEIMLGSGDLREFWSKTARFSKSLAVMSVLGYVVGLGDRHLDNILLCTKSGEVVHIDYNVCFDKGQMLKVPEVVPFRLTPMLQDALGLTGVEGKFRVAFDATLRVVRAPDSRELLLALLETFVYDPLVDWTDHEDRRGRSGDLKTRLEVNVNLSLFLSRAEERRQDTTLFGHRFAETATALVSSVKAANIQLVELCHERKVIKSLEQESNTLSKEILRVETKLSEWLRSQRDMHAEIESINRQFENMNSRLATFADECLSRHHQIVRWQKKSVEFSKSDSVCNFLRFLPYTSIQQIYCSICEVVAKCHVPPHSRELLLSLAPKCEAIDADISRLRYRVKQIAEKLCPYLISYGQCREQIDEYIRAECGLANDVYFCWWQRCSDYLKALNDNETSTAMELLSPEARSARVVPVSSTESLSASIRFLYEMNQIQMDYASLANSANGNASLTGPDELDQLTHNLADALSTMKLSNAQCQRVMKLAGACWIISALQKLKEESSEETKQDVITIQPTLVLYSLFRKMLSMANAMCILLELVSTPKGSIKRLRATDLLVYDNASPKRKECTSCPGKAVHELIGVLLAIQQFAVTVHNEFYLEVHDIKSNRETYIESLRYLEDQAGNISDAHVVIAAVATCSSDVSNQYSQLRDIFARVPAIREVLLAVAQFLNKLGSFADTLNSIRPFSSTETVNNDVGFKWTRLALKIAALFISEDMDTECAKARAGELLFAHVSNFLQEYLVAAVQKVLLDIISSEWKFGFSFLIDADWNDNTKSTLSKRWENFFVDEISEIVPSWGAACDDSPRTEFRGVSSLLIELMNNYERAWIQQWQIVESSRLQETINTLKRRHECRLRYFQWITPQSESDYANQLTKDQLLGFLSTQVGELNVLLSDQMALESSVLEIAQQLEYFISELPLDSNSSFASRAVDRNGNDGADNYLHRLVQEWYSSVSSLFTYSRDMADLVQGISVIETSSRDQEVMDMKLEVDAMGEMIFQQAREVSEALRSANSKVLTIEPVIAGLQEEMVHIKSSIDSNTVAKANHQRMIDELCRGKNAELLSLGRTIELHAEKMLSVLKSFEKFKSLSKDTFGGSIEDTGLRISHKLVSTNDGTHQLAGSRRNTKQVSDTSSSASIKEAPTFSFVENERLVKILLRSVKAVKHLTVLENTLEKYEINYTSLQDVVAVMDQALRKYIDDVEGLGILEDEQIMSATLPSSFLAVAQGVAVTTLNGDIATGSSSGIEETGCADSKLTIFYRILDAVMDLVGTLTNTVEMKESSPSRTWSQISEDTIISVAQKLVEECLQLFFDATEMADRMSTVEDVDIEVSVGDDHELGEDRGGIEEDSEYATTAERLSGDDQSLTEYDNGPTTAASAPKMQEKNRHGVEVLRRIEEKLMGKVADVASPNLLTVEQQTSWLIEEATKVDNLCVMYEGWTPWI